MKQIERDNKRDVGIDITRIIAFLSVPSVHFFLHSGFYERDINCSRMFVMVGMRTFFMICVPLFLIITGYLMIPKRISLKIDRLKHFYFKLSKVVTIYIICSGIISAFDSIYDKTPLLIWDTVLNIFSYRIGYSWYVEMYIGLFLLIPVLNSVWHSDNNRLAHIGIVAALLFLTTAPSFMNIWDFDSLDAIIHPWNSAGDDKLIPQFWNVLYPISYYYIGAYIRTEIDLKKIKTNKMLSMLIICIACFTLFNIWRSHNGPFANGLWETWSGFQNVVDATLVFLLINSIDYKMPGKVAGVINHIADITFAAYLLSVIPDKIIYPILKEEIPIMTRRLNYFPVVVGMTITVSLLLAAIVQLLYYGIKNRGRITKTTGC